jgi:outer membrane protein OmpA-like peptidoglycan-associated protein
VNGFVGYGWANGFRTEFEVGYKKNDIKSLAPTGGAGTGRSEVWTGMVNVLYDIKLNSPIKPFIGAGIGFANWDIKGGPRSNAALRVNDDVTGPAWQGIVGVGYDINPNWTVTAEYRYFETPFIEDDKPRGIRNDYSSQLALIGLRYNFGVKQQVVQQVKQAAPAPVVAQAPKSYLVFFDFDRSDLTPEAGNIVRTAAANAKTGNVTRIEVTGHADRSGSDAYNERLSRRRAQTVQAELERNGIPASSISVQALGESQPLVPTPDGVREPQNRRVEIVYR